MEGRTRVGMFHELAPTTSVVVGRQVAVDDWVRACGSLCREHHVDLYTPSRQTRELAGQLALAECLTVRDRRELAGAGAEPPRVWHDHHFDTHLPFVVRSQLAAAYPITITHHTLSYPSLLHQSILPLLLAETAPHDAMICTSTAAERALRELVSLVAERFAARHGLELDYRGRFVTIPLGIDTERFAPADRTLARERFELPDDALVLLWLGRLSAVDKADLLPTLQTFADLVKARPEKKLMLVFAGSQHAGEQHGDVLGSCAGELGIRESVRVMTDHQAFHPWRPLLYSAADVFLSPIDNIQETFGITPIEAMACGVPAVVSDWNGYRDGVVDGQTGFLLPTHWCDCTEEVSWASPLAEPSYDHLALAQSVAVDQGVLRTVLERLIDDEALRTRLGTQARARAVEHYAWPVVVARYEALWIELAAASASAVAGTPDHAVPDYGRSFGHFASDALDPDAELRLTERGRRWLRGTEPLPSHHNVTWQHLDLDLLRRIMAGFGKMDVKDSGLSTARVVAVIARGRDDALLRARVLRHVMWLIKYDGVSLGGGPH